MKKGIGGIERRTIKMDVLIVIEKEWLGRLSMNFKFGGQTGAQRWVDVAWAGKPTSGEHDVTVETYWKPLGKQSAESSSPFFFEERAKKDTMEGIVALTAMWTLLADAVPPRAKDAPSDRLVTAILKQQTFLAWRQTFLGPVQLAQGVKPGISVGEPAIVWYDLRNKLRDFARDEASVQLLTYGSRGILDEIHLASISGRESGGIDRNEPTLCETLET